ncbi:MAG TPA: zf-HC2 domain-containing protein [bacterium]|nr:zf-HC2 domain-containing protein [bacterium]
MKDCKKIHPLLSLYAEGALTPAEAKKVEAHLASCADARRELEQHRKVRQALLALPEPAYPKDLHERIMGRVTGKVRPLKTHRPFLNFPMATLVVAASLVLYVLVANPELMRLGHPPATEKNQEALKNEIVASANAPAPAQEVGKAARTSVAQKDKNLDHVTANYGYSNASDTMKEAEEKPGLPPPQPFASAKRVKKSEAPRAMAVENNVRDEAQPSTQADFKKTLSETGSANLGLMSAGAPAKAAPEARSALAPPTPVPTEGSMANIAFSKQITASTWSGDNGPSSVEGGRLVTDAAQFEALWKTLRPNETVPTVDFTTQAVVLLEAGEEPTGGYKVSLAQMEDKGNDLLLHYRIEPPVGRATQVLTHPWSLQVIPKPSLPVLFQKD